MGKINKILMGSIILLILIFGCGKTPKPDAPDEIFYIDLSPDSIAAGIGDTLSLTGSINSVEGLFAMSFDLVFDTSIVAFISVSLPQNSILGQNAISFGNEIEGGVSISLGRTQTEVNDNISASGQLFVVDFSVSGAGSTEILYQNIYIIDQDGVENPDLENIEARGAQVTVN